MPTVDLNRLYKVRSRERAPVHKSVNVPDAAGAYLRAVRPAQQAQLGIARDNAELDNDKWRRRMQGIQTGIRAFGDVYDTTSRAIEIKRRAEERQKAIDLKKAQNDFQIAWLGARQGILETPYDRTARDDDGNVSPKGPGTAAKEWLAAYDRTQIPESVREEFDEWFALRSAEINAEADAAHEKLRRADVQATQATEMAIAEQNVAQYLDLENLSEYEKATKDAVQTAQTQFLVAIRAKDVAGKSLRDTDEDGNPLLTDSEKVAFDSIARDLQDKYNVQRLEHLAGVLASIDDPGDPRVAEITAHLAAWGMTADEYAAQKKVQTDFYPEAETELRDDASRQKVRALLADATARHERRVDLADQERTASAQTAFNAAVGEARDALAGDDIGSVNNAWSIMQAATVQAENAASGIRDEGRRANFLADVRKSIENARAAYANDLLLRVGLGTLDANQQEVARADTAALYEDAQEGARLQAIDKMDLAIATSQANDFIGKFRATQPTVLGEVQTPEQKEEADRLLEELRAMPQGRTRDIIAQHLFGGVARSGGATGGGAPAKKFGKAEVSYQLANGANPADVLSQVERALEDTAISPETYVECLELCQGYMTFSKATKGDGQAYGKAIFSAINRWLWMDEDLEDHVQMDSNGNPVWVASDAETGSRILQSGKGVLSKDAAMGGPIAAGDTKTVNLSDDTIAAAFKYGMQYVVRRANGLVEGRESAMTPEIIAAELQEEFETYLTAENTPLTNDIIRNRIETARQRFMPWNEARIEQARRLAIQGKSYP